MATRRGGVGEVRPLDHPDFEPEFASDGMWRPLEKDGHTIPHEERTEIVPGTTSDVRP